MTDPIPPTVEWRRGGVRLIDQRALPARLRFIQCRDVDTLCDAIATLAVRGAPALGAAGALRRRPCRPHVAHESAGARGGPPSRETRPTAVNLQWGVDLALDGFESGGAGGALEAAQAICVEDVARNRRLGDVGAGLLPVDGRVLTHCNTGSLACVGYGTALGVIRAAAEQQRRPRVLVDETRPLLQGARLTMWELDRLAIDATLVPDSAAAALMARGLVDVAIVGADRIAANGDVANKIGTYSVAIAARTHDIPFYVAAPTSTIDLATPTGAAIPIEERDPDEVFPGAHAYNPAFDVTPARLVTAIVTEEGIARPPFRRSLPAHAKRAR